MSAQGVTTTEKREGLAQLVLAVCLAGLFALMYFGRNLGGVPTPLGVDLGDALGFALDAVWLAMILWVIFSPPRDRNAWLMAVYLVLFPLMHLETDRQAHVLPALAASDLVVAAAGVLGGLSIIARRLWGAR